MSFFGVSHAVHNGVLRREAQTIRELNKVREDRDRIMRSYVAHCLIEGSHPPYTELFMSMHLSRDEADAFIERERAHLRTSGILR